MAGKKVRVSPSRLHISKFSEARKGWMGPTQRWGSREPTAFLNLSLVPPPLRPGPRHSEGVSDPGVFVSASVYTSENTGNLTDRSPGMRKWTEGWLLGKAAACTGGRSALQRLHVLAPPRAPVGPKPLARSWGLGRGCIFRVSGSVGTKAMAGTERWATGWGHTAHLAAG